MISKDNMIRLVTKLQRLTIEKRIAWVKTRAQRVHSFDPEFFFETQSDGLHFKLYDKPGTVRDIFGVRILKPDYKGDSRFVLEIASPDTDEIERIDGLIGLDHLYQAVATASPVSELARRIDAFIEKDLTHATR